MFINRIKLYFLKRRYRKYNAHNETYIANFCDISRINVGRKTYGILHVVDFTPKDVKLVIGSYCSIAGGGGGSSYLAVSMKLIPFQLFHLK